MVNIYGHYDRTLKSRLSTNFGDKTLQWLIQNKLNSQGFDYATFYDNGSLLANPKFSTFVLNAYLNKIRCGIPWSSDGEVTQAINYNKAQTDTRKKLTHLISEIEDYGTSSTSVTPAEFKARLTTNYPKAKAAGLMFGVYNGWSEQYEMIVANSDFLVLHVYIPSANMSSGKRIYDYLCGSTNLGRYPNYAKAAKKLGKIYPISLLLSTEPSFGQTYFKTNPWLKPLQLLMPEFDVRATSEMRTNTIVNGEYIFQTAFSEVSKPLK